ncbi:MAG TPA: ATP-binding cassette domain-containing protein [Stellaceae bacterium]|nr:ATP-binding cassette domain-containing protein [Stellaceae bacterium]
MVTLSPLPAQDPPGTDKTGPAISVKGLVTRLGDRVIHDHLDLEIRRGEVMGVVGGSGSGKSILLHTIIGLRRPAAGTIKILGHDTAHVSRKVGIWLRMRGGVLFQDGALFSSLTVSDNIQVPLREHTNLTPRLTREIAAVKLALVGLPLDTGAKYPSELSGGMRKRAGLARALALDPDILFLDEPTAGLDPISADGFDHLLRDLQSSLGLTVFMVTHDIDTLRMTTDRVSVLLEGRMITGTIDELRQDGHPWIQDYFNGARSRAALAI